MNIRLTKKNLSEDIELRLLSHIHGMHFSCRNMQRNTIQPSNIEFIRFPDFSENVQSFHKGIIKVL